MCLEAIAAGPVRVEGLSCSALFCSALLCLLCSSRLCPRLRRCSDGRLLGGGAGSKGLAASLRCLVREASRGAGAAGSAWW